MLIGIDFRLANVSNRGMARYVREIVCALMELDSINNYILYINKGEKINIHLKSNFSLGYIANKNLIIGEQIGIARKTYSDKLDCLWSPYNTFPLLINPKTKLLVTIHDLIFFSSLFTGTSFQKIGRLYRRSCLLLGHKRIDKCFTVSQYSASEIKKRFNLSTVYITYNCIDAFWNKVQKIIESNREPLMRENFYFTISGDAPHKNLPFLVSFFKRHRPNDTLIIAGVSSTSSLRKENTKNIIFLNNNLSDEEIIEYYLKCKAFIFLSLEEGFGIPVLEAMACEAPLIVSDRTSLPEVVGDCGILISPNSEDELMKAMESIDTFKVSETTRLNQLQKFLHWSDSAKVVLNQIINSNRHNSKTL